MRITFHRADKLDYQHEVVEMATILAAIPGMEGVAHALMTPLRDIEAIQQMLDPEKVRVWEDESGDRHVTIWPEGVQELAKLALAAAQWMAANTSAFIPLEALSGELQNAYQVALEALAPPKRSD